MLAVGVIRSERLLRDDLETNYRAFKGDVPEDLLAPCNIASIAAASGFNRETTRRKVDRLVEAGKLVRDGQVVKYDQRFFKQETFLKMVDAELDDVLKTTNELLRDGVVQVHRSVQNRSIKAESR
jgi:DNA-binding IclR family transcriptional regulator